MRELSMFEVGLLVGRLGLTEESLDEILFGGKRYEIIEITEKYHDEPTLLADMDNSCDPEHFETSVKLPDEAFKTVRGNDVDVSGEEFETSVQLPDEAFKTVTEEDDVPGLNDEMTEKEEPEFEEASIGEVSDIIENPEELTDSWNGEENKSTLLANKESGSESSNPWITNKWETFE